MMLSSRGLIGPRIQTGTHGKTHRCSTRSPRSRGATSLSMEHASQRLGEGEPPSRARSGIEPTGAPIEMTGIDVYEFEGDLVRRVVAETDTMPLLVKIGAVPALEASR